MRFPFIVKVMVLTFIAYIFMGETGPDFNFKEEIENSEIYQVLTTPPIEDETIDLEPSEDLTKVIDKEKLGVIAQKTKSLSYIERKAIGMFNSWSKTPEGKIWLDRAIKMAPANDQAQVEQFYRPWILDNITLKEGNGRQAVCGDTAQVKNITSGEEFNFEFGTKNTDPAIQYGLIDSKIGSERKIVTSDSKIHHLNLMDLSPSEIPAVQYYNKEYRLRFAIPCGATIFAEFKVIDVSNGQMIYRHLPGEYQKITLNNHIPFGMLQGLVGMSQLGTRAIILTPRLQRDINNQPVRRFFPAKWLIHPDKTYLVEVTHVKFKQEDDGTPILTQYDHGKVKAIQNKK